MNSLLSYTAARLSEAGYTKCTYHDERFLKPHDNGYLHFVDLLTDHAGMHTLYYGVSFYDTTDGSLNWYLANGIGEGSNGLARIVPVETEADIDSAVTFILRDLADLHNKSQAEIMQIVKDDFDRFTSDVDAILLPYFGTCDENGIYRAHRRGYDLTVTFHQTFFGDWYYFDFRISRPEETGYDMCFFHSVKNGNRSFHDWQVGSHEALHRDLKHMVETVVVPFLSGRLESLGASEFVQKRCLCGRDHCERCWVEKNVFDHPVSIDFGFENALTGMR